MASMLLRPWRLVLMPSASEERSCSPMMKKARQAWACMTALARYMDLEIVDIAFKVKGDPYRYSAGIIVKDGEGKA